MQHILATFVMYYIDCQTANLPQRLWHYMSYALYTLYIIYHISPVKVGHVVFSKKKNNKKKKKKVQCLDLIKIKK